MYLVDELERLGYIEGVPDPEDGRAKLVKPTTRAREAVELGRQEMAAIEREWTALLGERDMKHLTRSLHADAAGGVATENGPIGSHLVCEKKREPDRSLAAVSLPRESEAHRAPFCSERYLSAIDELSRVSLHEPEAPRVAGQPAVRRRWTQVELGRVAMQGLAE